MRHPWILATLTLACSLPAFAQPSNQLRLDPGEKLRFIQIAVRPTFVSPSAITVEEGLYQISVLDPNLLVTGVPISFEDGRGVADRKAPTPSKSPRVVYAQRLVPGSYRLRIGTGDGRVVQLTVTAKKPAGVL